MGKLLPKVELTNTALLKREKFFAKNFCFYFGLQSGELYGFQVCYSNMMPLDKYVKKILKTIKLSRKISHFQILKPIGYHLASNQIVLCYKTSPLSPLVKNLNDIDVLQVAGQLAAILVHLHEKSILLNDFRFRSQRTWISLTYETFPCKRPS